MLHAFFKCQCLAFKYLTFTAYSICHRFEEVKGKLHQNKEEILKFMAPNGMVANLLKTKLLVMNKNKEEIVKIKVGESYIVQEQVAKLLGVMVDDEMGWKEQVH